MSCVKPHSREISSLSDPAASWRERFFRWYAWPRSTYLDDNNKLGLKERGVYCWIHDRCTRLERFEEAADILAGREIILEKDLLCLRDVSFSESSRRTRFDIAVLNKTRRASSWGDLSMLSTPNLSGY